MVVEASSIGAVLSLKFEAPSQSSLRKRILNFKSVLFNSKKRLAYIRLKKTKQTNSDQQLYK